MKRIIFLIITLMLCCSCVSKEARVNQSRAAGNIWHAADALQKGANAAIILPRIKQQAKLIYLTNKHHIKGADNGND